MNIHDIAYQTTNFYVSMNYKLVIQFFIHNVSCKSSKRTQMIIQTRFVIQKLIFL